MSVAKVKDFSASFASCQKSFEAGTTGNRAEPRLWRGLKVSHQALQRELKLKEKALAEAA